MALCTDPLQRNCLMHVMWDGAWCRECQALRQQYGTPEVYALAHATHEPERRGGIEVDPDPADITEPRHGGNPESVTAHLSTPAQERERQRARVLGYIRDNGPATCDEVMAALEMTHQSCSPRFTELRRRGQLIHTGEKRPTRSGRPAAVHALPPTT